MNKKIYNILKNIKKYNYLIVDTENILKEILKNEMKIEYFLYSEKLEKNIKKYFKLKDVKIIKTKNSYIEKFSNIKSHQNFLAIVKIPEMNKINNIFEPKKYVLLDNIQDPGNLGTIIRSGSGFGFEYYLFLNCVYLYNEKVIRSSAGSVFNIKYKNITLEDFYKLKKHYKIIITDIKEGCDIENFKIKEKYIMIFGNEGHGISNNIKQNSDYKIKIYHNNKINSLNVAVASGIIFYELSKRYK